MNDVWRQSPVTHARLTEQARGVLNATAMERRESAATSSALELVMSIVATATAANAELGHENLGPLSWQRGFFPEHPPQTRLAPEFAAWDEAAAELPRLYSSLSLRQQLEALPLLDACALRARDLQRAATVLAMLSHAYRQVVFDRTTTLPPALATPWQAVCQRLGRPQAMMTYPDLILFNWRERSGSRGRRTVADMDLLVPAVGTEEERVFYLTQTEITARLAPLLRHYVAAHAAHAAGEWGQVESELASIAALLRGVTRQTLRSLTAAGAQRIDPVVWAKTVAPLAVSTSNDLPGPSGTSNPALHLLDAITGRKRYASRLGAESIALRATFPIHWRTLFHALDLLPNLGEVLSESAPATLVNAWQAVVSGYLGPRGLLERHRIKVYGFIEVAFKVGRSVTIGGFAGPFAAKTWEEVDDALMDAKGERSPPFPRSPQSRPSEVLDRPVADAATEPWQSLDISAAETWSLRAFYMRALESGQALIRARGLAFDVSAMFDKHPGGPEVIRLYLGRDASAAFERVGHTTDPHVVRMLQKTLVGKVVEGQSVAQVAVRQALERVLEVREAFRLETALLPKALTAVEDAARAPSNLGHWHGRDALTRLRGSFIHWALRDGVFALLHAQCGRFATDEDWSGPRRLELALDALARTDLSSSELALAHSALDRLMLACALAVAPLISDSLEPHHSEPSPTQYSACAQRLIALSVEHATELEALLRASSV